MEQAGRTNESLFIGERYIYIYIYKKVFIKIKCNCIIRRADQSYGFIAKRSVYLIMAQLQSGTK